MTTSADISLTFDDSLSIGLPQPLGVSAGITEIPKISIGLDPLTIEPLTITVNPLELSIGITEIPSVRVHFPTNFSVALSILGRELFCARLCGEAQVITEPYEPNPCESCQDEQSSQSADKPQPPSARDR